MSSFRCPYCLSHDNDVKDSRPRSDGYVYRRRYCNSCSTSVATVEVLEETWDAIFGLRGALFKAAQSLNDTVRHFNAVRRAVKGTKVRAEVVVFQRDRKAK